MPLGWLIGVGGGAVVRWNGSVLGGQIVLRPLPIGPARLSRGCGVEGGGRGWGGRGRAWCDGGRAAI